MRRAATRDIASSVHSSASPSRAPHSHNPPPPILILNNVYTTMKIWRIPRYDCTRAENDNLQHTMAVRPSSIVAQQPPPPAQCLLCRRHRCGRLARLRVATGRNLHSHAPAPTYISLLILHTKGMGGDSNDFAACGYIRVRRRELEQRVQRAPSHRWWGHFHTPLLPVYFSRDSPDKTNRGGGRGMAALRLLIAGGTSGCP
jgi:hypothetical protein